MPFVNADALQLPFADGTFDAVTISYGLRNVEDTVAALTEMRRVTAAGGVIVIAEFSTPTWAPFRAVYREWIMAALPALARPFSSNPRAYDYLAESILAWPNQAKLANLLREAGWSDVEWKNLSGGIVALHRAVRTYFLQRVDDPREAHPERAANELLLLHRGGPLTARMAGVPAATLPTLHRATPADHGWMLELIERDEGARAARIAGNAAALGVPGLVVVTGAAPAALALRGKQSLAELKRRLDARLDRLLKQPKA